MPENLRDIDSYVQSLHVSIETETAARCFAASSCSTRECWITAQEPDPTGVDPASQSAVERYLRGIVAPLRFATIGAMWEDISLLEFYDAAVDVVALHEIRPALAQAALRLDIAGLWRMAAPPDDRITELLDALVPQLLAIAVLGHVKHYAQALAVQLHRPTGLPALDRLDYDRQAPKLGTVCREFSHNLEVAQLLSEAYTPSTQLVESRGIAMHQRATREPFVS